jgi:hypothetical protein
MTVEELIDRLKEYPPSDTVKVDNMGKWGCPVDVTDVYGSYEGPDEECLDPIVILDICSQGT